VRIATFNANSVRSRLDAILGWLRTHDPDALCLQETKAQDADFPARPFADAGWHVAFRGEKAYNGVAVVSRLKPAQVRFGLDDGGPADEARLLCARIGPVWVVNTYVPQGREIEHPMYRYKIEWFRRLRQYFDRHFSARSPLVWVGDMNVAPQPIDVHNAERQARHVCYHEDARQAYADALGWGFVDVFRLHHPEPGHYTFFDYRMAGSVSRGMGWRVDHILASPALARRCTGAFIDLEPRRRPGASDHTFMVADFDVTPSPRGRVPRSA